MGTTDTTADSDEPIHETTPSTKLVKLWLGITLLVGLPVTGYLLAVPDAFGTEGFGGVAGVFIALLTVVGAGRYAVRWLILRRTTYTVTGEFESIERKEGGSGVFDVLTMKYEATDDGDPVFVTRSSMILMREA